MDKWAAWLHSQETFDLPNGQRPFTGLGATRTTGQRLAAARVRRAPVVEVHHLAWQDAAACRGSDPEDFFTDEPTPAIAALCLGCPVRQTCFEYAMANQVAGIWAGTTDRERRRMSRSQRDQAARERRREHA